MSEQQADPAFSRASSAALLHLRTPFFATLALSATCHELRRLWYIRASFVARSRGGRDGRATGCDQRNVDTVY